MQLASIRPSWPWTDDHGVIYICNAYCAITKEGNNDIWAVRPQGVVLLLPLCSQIDVGATVNALLGDTFSRENNTHGSRFHDRDPQFASRILGAMTQSCYIGTRDIRSRVIRGLYCIKLVLNIPKKIFRTSNYEDKTFLQRSYLHNGVSFTDKIATKFLNVFPKIWQYVVCALLPSQLKKLTVQSITVILPCFQEDLYDKMDVTCEWNFAVSQL